MLSVVFDPLLDSYLEKQNLEDVLQRTVSEDAVDRDGALPVLSVHVFAYIKASVGGVHDRARPSFVHRAFSECLKSYAAQLGGLLDVVDAPQQQKSVAGRRFVRCHEAASNRAERVGWRGPRD